MKRAMHVRSISRELERGVSHQHHSNTATITSPTPKVTLPSPKHTTFHLQPLPAYARGRLPPGDDCVVGPQETGAGGEEEDWNSICYLSRRLAHRHTRIRFQRPV